MRPVGSNRSLAEFTAFQKVFTACSTVFVSQASLRYLSQDSAKRAQFAFMKLM